MSIKKEIDLRNSFQHSAIQFRITMEDPNEDIDISQGRCGDYCGLHRIAHFTATWTLFNDANEAQTSAATLDHTVTRKRLLPAP
jgi:hypothetical protein